MRFQIALAVAVSFLALHAHAAPTDPGASDVLAVPPAALPATEPMTHEAAGARIRAIFAPLFHEVLEQQKQGKLETDDEIDEFMRRSPIGNLDASSRNALQIVLNESLTEVSKVRASVSKSDPDYRKKLEQAFEVERLGVAVAMNDQLIRLALGKSPSDVDVFEIMKLLSKYDLLESRFPSAAEMESDGTRLTLGKAFRDKLAATYAPQPPATDDDQTARKTPIEGAQQPGEKTAKPAPEGKTSL